MRKTTTEGAGSSGGLRISRDSREPTTLVAVSRELKLDGPRPHGRSAEVAEYE